MAALGVVIAIFDQLGTLAQNAPPAVVAQLRTDLEELSEQLTEQNDDSNAAAARYVLRSTI